MRLLDTNILSEIVRPRPHPQVMARLFAETHGTLFASEITRYELRRGARLRPDAEVFWARLEMLALPVVEWLPVTQPISLRAADLPVARIGDSTRVCKGGCLVGRAGR